MILIHIEDGGTTTSQEWGPDGARPGTTASEEKGPGWSSPWNHVANVCLKSSGIKLMVDIFQGETHLRLHFFDKD